MLKRTLQELAIGALFSSRDVADHLRDFLLCTTDGSAEALHENCLRAVAATLDRDHPRLFRLNDIERVVVGVGSFLATPDMPLLGELFQRLMMRNGDYLQYRERQVQAYTRLAAEIDPTLLGGWHLAEWTENMSEPLPHDVRRVISAQLPMFAPAPIANKPFAEGHVHLGGVAFDGMLLAHHLFSEGQTDKAHDTTIRRLRRVLGVLLACTMETSSLDVRHAPSLEMQLRNACDDQYFDANAVLAPDWRSVADACVLSGRVDQSWLLFQMASELTRERLSAAWLWLVIYLWSLFRARTTPLCVRVAVSYLFTELMYLRRRIIMDGQGLSRFTRHYFSAPLRKPKDLRAPDTDNAHRLLVGINDLAEIKIGPGAFTPNLVGRFAKAVRHRHGVPRSSGAIDRSSVDEPPTAPGEASHDLDRWHFCLHLLRSGSEKKTRREFQRAQWKEADELRRSLQQTLQWRRAIFPDEKDSDLEFQPARWMRGLDVAGDENAVRIELFAPVLRALRAGFWRRPDEEVASIGFHLSIHAGEDFAHPLSGMRHVDETVRFCEMRSGDRLGHALALGIPPAAWFARQGDMVVPVDEHLDNLVWAWHYACELTSVLPLAGQILPRLERRIARFAPEVSWLSEVDGKPLLWPSETTRKYGPQFEPRRLSRKRLPGPDVLYRAWTLRRNCGAKFSEYACCGVFDEWLPSAVPDYLALRRAMSEDTPVSPETIYLARETMYELYDSASKKPVLVRVADQAGQDVAQQSEGADARETATFLYDHESAADIEFMHALQDYLLEQYDQHGLIIEANPSSNVFIARLESHSEHPIFRWNPPDDAQLAPGARHNRFGLRRGPIQVLINTDDPGIMPTTLRTEFALLLEAGIDQGYSRTAVENWLERLRQAGIDQFHRNHLPIVPACT